MLASHLTPTYDSLRPSGELAHVREIHWGSLLQVVQSSQMMETPEILCHTDGEIRSLERNKKNLNIHRIFNNFSVCDCLCVYKVLVTNHLIMTVVSEVFKQARFAGGISEMEYQVPVNKYFNDSTRFANLYIFPIEE